jgi:hypothetical protein
MKKQVRKVKRLEIHRETLVRLTDEDVRKAQGQGVNDCTGCDSGCGIFVNNVAE